MCDVTGRRQVIAQNTQLLLLINN